MRAGTVIQLGLEEMGGKESSSTANTRAMNDLYDELETPEGGRKISRITKANAFRQEQSDRDEQRVVWWKGYFDKLLNG